jgi:hypothetical protein
VKGYLHSPPSSLSSPRHFSGSVPICATWIVISSRNPLSCRERVPLQRGPAPPLDSPHRDVSVPACATWAGTSSRPSLPSSSSWHLTQPEGGLSDGKSTPFVTRNEPVPRTPRPASRLALRGLRPAWRSALRPRYNLYSPATSLPTSPATSI